MLLLHMLAAAAAHAFPAAVEVNFSPFGLRTASAAARMWIAAETAAGKRYVSPTFIETAADAAPDDAAMLTKTLLSADPKWRFQMTGVSVVLIEYDGSPVTKVEVKSTGTKPIVRWIPRKQP